MKSRLCSIVAIGWGYLIELVLAGLFYVMIWWLWGFAAIQTFLDKTATEWATLTGALFTASLAIWLTFVNIRATDFGDYLDSKRAVAVYSAAFITAMVVYLAGTICLIAVKGSSNIAVGRIGLGLMLYGGINLVTLVRNATGLVRLYGIFRRELRKAQARAYGEDAE
jgi:hypothetical protein